MKSARPISGELLARCKKAYDEDRQAHLMTAAAAQTPLAKIAMDPVKAAKVGDTFSIELKTRGITAQQQSGRCWLFASMNVMREVVAEKCEMDKFELSGNWLAFWDKFEKINFCLEAILDCADLPTADRTVNWVLSGMNDGGQWDMMVSIVKKYGIVPNSVMPETEQSKSTRGISQIINMKGRTPLPGRTRCWWSILRLCVLRLAGRWTPSILSTLIKTENIMWIVI